MVEGGRYDLVWGIFRRANCSWRRRSIPAPNTPKVRWRRNPANRRLPALSVKSIAKSRATAPASRSGAAFCGPQPRSSAARMAPTRSAIWSGESPSSAARIKAEPTTTPSECSAAATACSGAGNAEAHYYRLVRHRLQALGQHRGARRQVLSFARHAHQVDPVDKAVRSLANGRQPFVRRHRGGQQDGFDALGGGVLLPFPPTPRGAGRARSPP